MVELFVQHNVSAPASQVVATDSGGLPPGSGVWIKRYDFHATQPDDVMYTASGEGWRKALQDDPALALGLNTHAGAVICPPVAAAHRLDAVAVERVLSST